MFLIQATRCRIQMKSRRSITCGTIVKELLLLLDWSTFQKVLIFGFSRICVFVVTAILSSSLSVKFSAEKSYWGIHIGFITSPMAIVPVLTIGSEVTYNLINFWLLRSIRRYRWTLESSKLKNYGHLKILE